MASHDASKDSDINIQFLSFWSWLADHEVLSLGLAVNDNKEILVNIIVWGFSRKEVVNKI